MRIFRFPPPGLGAALLFPLAMAMAGGTGPARAHPRFAADMGRSCAQCHVDVQGGGLRNSFGVQQYSRTILPAITAGDLGYDDFDTEIHERIRLGADTRVQFYDYDDGGEAENAFFPMQADVYFGVRPADHLLFYYEQNILETVAATAVWAQISDGDGEDYLRVGRFRQTYGLRIDDHTAYIRGGNVGGLMIGRSTAGIDPVLQGLHWKPRNYTAGVEARYALMDMAVTGSVGKRPADDEYSYAADLSMPYSLGPLKGFGGVSWFRGSYYGRIDPYSYYGIYTGVSVGPMVFLAELDAAEDYAAEDARSMAAYGEVTWSVREWIHLRGEYHLFDADTGSQDDRLDMYAAGIELFPVPFVEIEPLFRYVEAEADPDFSRSEFILQVHFWL